MKFTNEATAEIQRTFMKPPRTRIRKGSLLLWLRKDLEALYGAEGRVGGSIRAPLLAALGVCAGLELLAKYWSGKTAPAQVEVTHFLTSIAGLTAADAETLVQFRNSLTHGYGMATRRRKDDRPFMFAVDPDNAGARSVVSPSGPDLYVIHLWPLKRLFLSSIARCRSSIEADWKRAGDFQACIRNLREIELR